MNDQSACHFQVCKHYKKLDVNRFANLSESLWSLSRVTLDLNRFNQCLGTFVCVCPGGISRYLVELQHIQEVKELPILLVVLQLDVVLLEAMKRQLGLIVHKNFHRLGQPVEAGGR